jgi:hypothetical protein
MGLTAYARAFIDNVDDGSCELMSQKHTWMISIHNSSMPSARGALGQRRLVRFFYTTIRQGIYKAHLQSRIQKNTSQFREDDSSK